MKLGDVAVWLASEPVDMRKGADTSPREGMSLNHSAEINDSRPCDFHGNSSSWQKLQDAPI